MHIQKIKSAVGHIPVVGPILRGAYRFLKNPSQHTEAAPVVAGLSPGETLTTFPDWDESKNILPWFDQPDALEVLESRLEAGEVSHKDYELLKKWITDGYVVLDPGSVPDADIDGMVKDLDGLFTEKAPRPGLTFQGLRASEDEVPEVMGHEKVLSFPEDVRKKMPLNSNWRIHEFHAYSESARKIYQNREVMRVCSLIFGKPAIARSTINFMYGSEQLLHQDMAVFHIFPHNYLIGAWLACEDIKPESGPLLYYPGSHRVPMWERFNNYPQTQLRTAAPVDHDGYHEHIAKAAERFERKEFIAKKGQVLLWHGALIHGGSGIKQKGVSRKSFVIHYLTDGVDHTKHVQGPFNWN